MFFPTQCELPAVAPNLKYPISEASPPTPKKGGDDRFLNQNLGSGKKKKLGTKWEIPPNQGERALISQLQAVSTPPPIPLSSQI